MSFQTRFISLIVLLLISVGIFVMGISKGKHIEPEPFKYTGYETSDTNYRNGQILYPDYVHTDTLVVVNADSLNWCIANYDIASDGDISDVLRAYTVPYDSSRLVREVLRDNE